MYNIMALVLWGESQCAPPPPPGYNPGHGHGRLKEASSLLILVTTFISSTDLVDHTIVC